MNTSAIFKKAREEKEAAIAELKTQQERDIAALRAEYEKKIANTGGTPAVDGGYAEKLAAEVGAVRTEYDAKIKELERRLEEAHGADETLRSKLTQAESDLQAWSAAYQELQRTMEEERNTHQEEVDLLKAMNSSGETPGEQGDAAEALKKVTALSEQLERTQQELEAAHQTHRETIGDMQNDYEAQLRSVKAKLGEVVKRFKLLKMQNDSMRQTIQNMQEAPPAADSGN